MMNKKLLLVVLFLTLENGYVKSKSYNILDFGTTADGRTLATVAGQIAIDACFLNRGGRVVVPKGEFLAAAVFFIPIPS